MAAMTGFPAIAFSLDRAPENEAKWDTVERHFAETLHWMLSVSWPRGMVLNVNFPDVLPDAVKGRRVATVGRRKPAGEIIKGQDPAGKPYHWISSKRVYGEVSADSDIQATRDGFISMSPLTLDMTDYSYLSAAREKLG